jgi:lipopolysaccharide/colanic/teichoic acid biosynthesis glycosyltransferase
MYQKFWKRFLDFTLSLVALVVFSPVLLVLTVVGAVVMRGNPFFTQIRPGKDEKLFRLVKFRSMSNLKDKDGNLLPDEKRLTTYGKFIRATSLDELPELFNILVGDMSIVGPRPQLVRDMVFMTPRQRRRHSVRQGLTGLAQCNGRNGISWEKKLEYDLQYIEKITFLGDLKIILKTVRSVLVREGINEEDAATAEDFGDYQLRTGKISPAQYREKQAQAEELLGVLR